jgi:pimeloyl-ACP methyl ester carboxylesterase
MTPHSRRLLKTAAAALFILLLAGVTYQGVATAIERRSFKYPGRMVPVGDHQLHLYCTGTGSPTVVLEAPALGFSGSWSLVQTQLQETTRVCAYDRAGLGWSEASTDPFDARVVPTELHTLLAGAGERAPYLLVGDGLGAAFATEFAGEFPGDTAALILLDAPRITQFSTGGRVRRPSPSPWLARTGVLRLMRLMTRDASVLPGPPTGAVRAFSLRPDHLTRAAEEIRTLDAVIARSNAVTLSSDLPVHRFETPDGEPLLATPAHADQVIRLVVRVVDDWRRLHGG